MSDQSPVFDVTALDDLHELQVEGEPSFVGGLITDYLAQLQDLISAIQNHAVAREVVLLEKASHKLKSSSAALGLTQIAGLCGAIEKAARDGAFADADVAQLTPSAAASRDVLTGYLQTLE